MEIDYQLVRFIERLLITLVTYGIGIRLLIWFMRQEAGRGEKLADLQQLLKRVADDKEGAEGASTIDQEILNDSGLTGQVGTGGSVKFGNVGYAFWFSTPALIFAGLVAYAWVNYSNPILFSAANPPPVEVLVQSRQDSSGIVRGAAGNDLQPAAFVDRIVAVFVRTEGADALTARSVQHISELSAMMAVIERETDAEFATFAAGLDFDALNQRISSAYAELAR